MIQFVITILGRFEKLKAVFFTSLVLLSSSVCAQEDQLAKLPEQIETDSAIIMAWLSDLYEHGVRIENDTIILNEEVRRIIADARYRQFIYPDSYSWEQALTSIQRLELKQAFWFLINLYLLSDENKDLVLKSLLSYDRFLIMDKVMVSTFYTYIFMDPEIGTIEDSRTKIIAPHVMEDKLNAVKEIIFYLDKYKPEDRDP